MLMTEFLRERHHLHHHIFFAGAHGDDARLERFRRDAGRERGALLPFLEPSQESNRWVFGGETYEVKPASVESV